MNFIQQNMHLVSFMIVDICGEITIGIPMSHVHRNIVHFTKDNMAFEYEGLNKRCLRPLTFRV